MAIFVLTVVGLMFAASAVNAEQINNFHMCRSEYCIDICIGDKHINYNIMSIKFYSVFMTHCFTVSFLFADTSCVVYDVFIDPCPEALDNQACELPQTVNASITFKYKSSIYKYSLNSTI